MRILSLALCLLTTLFPAEKAHPSQNNVSPDDAEFFEKRIRPFLGDHCIECHSAQQGKTKGGLAMDSRDLLLKGGDSGPALVPGQPSKSLLVLAARHEHSELHMPPKKPRLSDETLAPLEEWIRRGAPDPRPASASPVPPTAGKAVDGRAHWAFTPVNRPQALAVSAITEHPVDAILNEARRKKGVPAAEEADPRTLIRRLSYDLTGLPPSPEEVASFTANPTQESLRTLAMRYLNSPRFGEKWGRHWLDIARYADTRGVPVPITSDPRFLYAYAYRDYVISAFNEDKPFDQFIQEQIAIDILEPDRLEKHPALGFLTLGRTFLNNPHDIIDDRIDVVTRGLLGLTVSCARCHDHKFDPIPTTDYYALYGIFNSCEVPREPVVIRERADNPDRTDYLAQRAEKLAIAEEGLRAEARALNRITREKTAKYLLAVRDCENQPPANLDNLLAERGLTLLPFQKWRGDVQAAETHHPILGPWRVALLCARETPDTFGSAFLAQIKVHSAREGWNPALLAALQDAVPPDIDAVASAYQKALLSVDDEFRLCEAAAKKQKQPGPDSLSDAGREALRQWMERDGGPLGLTLPEVEKAFSRRFLERKQKLMETVEVLDGTHPGAPDRAIVLRDKAKPANATVFVRGNPGNPGVPVARRFLTVLSADGGLAYQRGSGRLELARDIASKNNPLTARVYVNRIWGLLFGKPLVSTPADFGIRTPPPALPELLDMLAFDFMEQGWSTKKLILSLVTSNAYRLSSQSHPAADELDPDNTLVHRMSRKRLTFESLRDTLIVASGQADFTQGGRPVSLTKAPFPLRRTVYGFVDRQDLPSVFRSFDFANPDTSTAERFQTTVPQQALFLLNNDFAVERAKALSKRLPDADPSERIQKLFEFVFQRPPSPREVELSLRHINNPAHNHSSPQNAPLSRWETLCQVLLLSNETIFLD